MSVSVWHRLKAWHPADETHTADAQCSRLPRPALRSLWRWCGRRREWQSCLLLVPPGNNKWQASTQNDHARDCKPDLQLAMAYCRAHCQSKTPAMKLSGMHCMGLEANSSFMTSVL